MVEEVSEGVRQGMANVRVHVHACVFECMGVEERGGRVGERMGVSELEGRRRAVQSLTPPQCPSLRLSVFPTLPLPVLLSPYPLPLQSPPATLALPIFNSLASPSIQFHQHQCTLARASRTHVHSLHMHFPCLTPSSLPSLSPPSASLPLASLPPVPPSFHCFPHTARPSLCLFLRLSYPPFA